MPSPGPPPGAPRFFCPTLPHPRLGGEPYCLLEADETHHARRVLRLQPGSALELFDGEGGLARAVLERFESGQTVCRVTDVAYHERLRPLISVATAIPKGPRADDMIDQLSQLGVDRLIPLQTQRSVVDPRSAKLERFARHALASAKQCGRLFVMEVEAVQPFEAVLAREADLRLFAAPGGGEPAEAGDLADRLRSAVSVLVLIGPEGGWTPEEEAAAAEAGMLAWSLGPYVLRIETAALAAAAVLRYLGGVSSS